MSTARYAVFGHPIAHSLSPQIHAAFARLRGISLEYTAIDATPDDFSAALERFAAAGGRGCNITLPLKEAAFALCAQVSDRARRAGACNTLTRVDGHWQGDNTDGAGLVHDLTSRHGLDLRARRVLLIGAGGAARGVAPALLDAGIDELVVVNRTPERADALVDALGEPGRAHSRYKLARAFACGNDDGDLGRSHESKSSKGVRPPAPQRPLSQVAGEERLT